MIAALAAKLPLNLVSSGNFKGKLPLHCRWSGNLAAIFLFDEVQNLLSRFWCQFSDISRCVGVIFSARWPAGRWGLGGREILAG